MGAGEAKRRPKRTKVRRRKAATVSEQRSEAPTQVDPVVPTAAPEAGQPTSPATQAEECLAKLLPQHLKLLVDSGISPEVALERGYASLTVKADIYRMGFKRAQCNVPALYLPVRGTTGAIVNHQIRPDRPRVGRKGTAVKYETPAGSKMTLDVPPRVRVHLGNHKDPLVITEGIRKADSAASKGIACIALLGVWNWRGTNEQGGKVALADWESIALNGREVYIAYDSDVTRNPSVYGALARLKGFLESRQAKVRIVHLPEGPNGQKTGLDDYLATGKGLEDLFALAKSELPSKPTNEDALSLIAPIYRAVESCIVRVAYDDEGNEELYKLTNFTAEIVANVVEDDGLVATRHFDVRVRRENLEREIRIAASEFGWMDWVAQHLGAEFIVTAGFGNRDHARAAIQQLSSEVEERVTYVHTGWRKVGNRWLYLHGGGAIGADGEVDGISVSLQAALGNYLLPPPPTGEDLHAAIRASMRTLDVAPDSISVPILAAIYRAPLGGSDFSEHLAGPTGGQKTELAALAQQHYGKDFHARNLPGSWSSTGNALEASAFIAKDALYVVDDFVPQGGWNDVLRIHREADRLLRAQGNNSGRQRMNPDGSLRPTRSPRGLVLSTGEDIPAGHSLRSRIVVIEMGTGSVSLNVLTLCQKDAREGLYAAAMSGYVRWLAAQREGLDDRLRERVNELRVQVSEHSSVSHRRTPDVVAQLFVGVEWFANFALEVGAITQPERDALMERGWRGLLDTAEQQGVFQETSDPVSQFFVLLKSALGAGEAHLLDGEGRPPQEWEPEAVGWMRSRVREAAGELGEWEPKGICVGWILDGELYLDGPSAYRAAQRMADEAGRLGVSQSTLGRRLAERGCLVSQEQRRRKCTTRKYIQGIRRDVLHIRLSLVLGQAPQAPSAPNPAVEGAEADSGPDDGACGETSNRPHDDQSRPHGSNYVATPGPVGPLEPVPGGDRSTRQESGGDGNPPRAGAGYRQAVAFPDDATRSVHDA